MRTEREETFCDGGAGSQEPSIDGSQTSLLYEPLRMLRVTLDTNVIRHLFTPSGALTASELRDARKTIARAARYGRIEVESCAWMLSEMASMSHGRVHEFMKCREFAHRLVDTRWLREFPDLVAAECSSPGETPRERRYLAPALVNRLRGAPLEVFRYASDELQAEYSGYVPDTKEQNEETRRRLAELGNVTELIERWWGDAEAQIENWTRGYLDHFAKELGWSNDRPVRSVRTAWRFYAYSMALIRVNVEHGPKSIRRSDNGDTRLYAAAGHSDLLVTDDGPFRETAKRIPGGGPELLSLEKLLARIG